MHAWESIQNVLDYIEENITESHSPERLSKVAALSSFYFQRLFTRLVKRPVSEYVKMRRLARACEVLSDKNKRIVDIALDCGFNSHEHFTKTFKGAFGITPEEYRNKPVHLAQVMKPNLLLGYTMIDEGVPLITDDIVIEITRRILDTPERYIGISAKVPVEQATFGENASISEPGQIWDDFHARKANINGLVPNSIELGASMLSDANDGTFVYFAGALANEQASSTEDTTPLELPSGEYVVCQFEAESFAELRTSAIDKALKYLFETWLPGHKLQIEPFSAEKYTAVNDDPAGMELWVKLLPAK
jgi:AraC family transcriptional regulator